MVGGVREFELLALPSVSSFNTSCFSSVLAVNELDSDTVSSRRKLTSSSVFSNSQIAPAGSSSCSTWLAEDVSESGIVEADRLLPLSPSNVKLKYVRRSDSRYSLTLALNSISVGFWEGFWMLPLLPASPLPLAPPSGLKPSDVLSWVVYTEECFGLVARHDGGRCCCWSGITGRAC